MGGENISIISDEKGQGAAEYILLFGGVIVIALVALQIYSNYFSGDTSFNVTNDSQEVRNTLRNNSS